NPQDEQASLHDRARAYLHVNCSHCHVANGGGNSAMQLAIHFADEGMGAIDGPPMHGTFGIAGAKIIAPGAPQSSLLIYRPAVRGEGAMPPAGTLKHDAEGVALLE